MAGAVAGVRRASRTRSISFVGLTIAIMAVSAWVAIPLGPVPFTLQMFALVFALLVLPSGEGVGAVAGYLAIGAVGVPVFSGMRGGIGVLAGPTGGFLWGYLVGAVVVALFLRVARPAEGSSAMRATGVDAVAAVLFTLISYACGAAQFMLVSGVGPMEALAASVLPFVVLDAAKLAAAVVCARAVRATVR